MFRRSRRRDLFPSLAPIVRKLVRDGLDVDTAMEKIEAATAEAIPRAVEESSEAVVLDLHRRAPELNERRKLDQAFKRRLAATWKKPFLLYEMVLTCAVEAGSEFNDAHRREAAKTGDFRFDVLTMLHSRACLVGGEILELMRGGYPYGAHARCRTLHELAVFSTIVGEHDQELAERFLLHTAIEDAAFVDTYQKNHNG